MRIDWDSRTLECSVGDLVQSTAQRRIGFDRGDGFRRMWIGQEIHTRRSEERAAADPHYRPELPVAFTTSVGDWTVSVSGRIDGISIDHDEKRIIIEEVKSVHFEMELAGLYRSDKLQRYFFQLMLYAWFLSHRDEYAGYSFITELVLIDLLSGRTDVLSPPFEPAEVRIAFDAAIEKTVNEIEAARALRLAKRAAAESIEFPFAEMRPYQEEMIEAVSRAVRQREALLVSAPTGVGKTMGALYPALREALRLGKKLYFLTSKTLQQEMAVEALSRLNDGSFRVLRIRAKRKMCAHTQTICHEDFCPFAARYGEKMEKTNLLAQIVSQQSYFDPDITYELAASATICPFEVSLELLDSADVVICDYNYVFDPYVGLKAAGEDRDFRDAILVIDEAHNLVERGRGYYSPELSSGKLDELRWHLLGLAGSVTEVWEDLLEQLRQEFELMSEELEGETPQALCELRTHFFVAQRSGWETILIRYIAWKIENRIAEENDPLVDFYFSLVRFVTLLLDGGEELAHIVERTSEGLRLKIFCKDPSRFLGEVIGSAHATIAMSATLTPFDFYRATLGFPSHRSSELDLPSPFPAENRKVLVIPEVETTWKTRAAHYDRIGELIATMADAVEGNVLVLFPSYAFLEQVLSRSSLYGRNVLVQRSEMTDYERSAFLDLLRGSERNNLVMAVSGGMYAEGIDYRGEMLSGVFVVGPALPAVTFEQELLKQYFDESHGTGFEFAYLVPGMTRVVQSAGRVIRSESDIGVIALLCRRFTFESYNRYFPADWYLGSPRELVTRQPAEAIRRFFEGHRLPLFR